MRQCLMLLHRIASDVMTVHYSVCLSEAFCSAKGVVQLKKAYRI